MLKRTARDFTNSRGEDTGVTVRELIAALSEFDRDTPVYLCSGLTGSPAYITNIRERHSRRLGVIVTLHSKR